MIPMLHQRLFSRFRIELNMHRRGQTDARTTAFCTARTIISTFNAGHVQRQTKGAAQWVVGWKGTGSIVGSSPEKASGGGSIPPLDNMFSVVYSHRPNRFGSIRDPSRCRSGL